LIFNKIKKPAFSGLAQPLTKMIRKVTWNTKEAFYKDVFIFVNDIANIQKIF